MPKHIEKLDDFIQRYDLQLVIFATRYEDEPFAAYLTSADGADCLSCILTGNDDSWMAIQQLCHFGWYPYAAGRNIASVISNLQRKLQFYFNEDGWVEALGQLSGASLHHVKRSDQIRRFETYVPHLASYIRDFLKSEDQR